MPTKDRHITRIFYDGNDGVDASTNSLQTISYAHHEVHSGSSFVCTDVQNLEEATVQWMITTTDTTKWAHIVFDIDCTGEFLVTITEGADRTGTNLLTCVNRNRNSSTMPTMVMHRAVSGGTTDGATTMWTHRAGATNSGGQSGSPGGSRGIEEFILKQNTKYIITIETFADVYVTFDVDFYEHTSKN